MDARDTISRVLSQRYHPRAMIVYGSYARGDWDEESDFDCLLIADSKPCDHDGSLIEGVTLDCFLFTVEETLAEDLDPFLPIVDGVIVFDDGVGCALMERVRRHVETHAQTSAEEKAFLRAWIEKTLRRTEKGDDEGHFRAAALLAESLEDYCLLRDRFYCGSQKTIAFLREYDPEGHALFQRAITHSGADSLRRWAEYIIRE